MAAGYEHSEDAGVLRSALARTTSSKQLRVISMKVGALSGFGSDTVEINPDMPLGLISWPDLLNGDQLQHYNGCGVALRLLQVLGSNFQMAERRVALRYLLALLLVSTDARQQLNRQLAGTCGRLSGELGAGHHPKDKEMLHAVERLCNEAMAETGFSKSNGQSWVGWGSSRYEVWLQLAGSPTVRVVAEGADKQAGVFDIQGNMTGGRLWVGSLCLLRWLRSLHHSQESRAMLSQGLILELGAGLGIVGIGCAKLGHKVVLSDREPALLQALQHNIKINQVEKNCQVLKLNWEVANKPKAAAFLQRAGFSLIIGAEVVYSPSHSQMLIGVIKSALHNGGAALFCNSKHHRYHAHAMVLFANQLEEAGFGVELATFSIDSQLQLLVCGSFEPGQECSTLTVTVPPQMDPNTFYT